MYKYLIRARKQRGAESEDIVFADGDDQTYGYVTQLLGNGRVLLLCCDGTTRTGRICGSMRKRRSRALVERGDIVLCCKRDFDDATVDVVRKYSLDDVRVLNRNKSLSDAIVKELTGSNAGGSCRGDAPDDQHFQFDTDVDLI